MSMKRCCLAATAMLCLALFFSVPAAAQGEPFAWNQPQAKVLPQGDLEWAPQPFFYEAGPTVRYIDYAGGDDTQPGTKAAPWKHHPWDLRARDRAAQHEGPTTYVFKGGVTYRGALIVEESGTAEEPIRLTRDPAWGEGEARFYGSRQVSGWQRGAHPDMPAGGQVWFTDIDFTPRHIWQVGEDGQVTALKLARTPNWDEHAVNRSPQAEWFAWENPRWWEGDPVRTTIDGRTMHLGVDTKNLTREPEYYEDALVWTQWGTMMGMPYAAEVEAYDPQRKAIAYQGPWHRDTGTIRTGHRYYLEDKPHYLDEAGEFWFDRDGGGGRLYVRLPNDADPNRTTMEAGEVINFIDGENYSHVHVSGLTFRFGTVHYDLAARGWEHEDVESGVVRMQGSGRDIAVRNCTFEHVSNAVQIEVGPEETFEDLLVADNRIEYTDHHAVNFSCRNNRAHGIRILRNRMHENGRRGIRPKDNFTVNLSRLQTAHVAGNIVTRAHAAGINMAGGKPGKVSESDQAAPMVRIIVHHNKVVDSLLSANDWGGIETWQSGPYYIYNNVSGNPVGPFHDSTFGFAYYMDGAFKNYLFNNIAWGRINDPEGLLPNFAAFQAIHSYQNMIFNNTAYKFMFGSRRQAPQAGRDKYLGNIFSDISEQVFRHTDAKNEDPNARDAGEQKRTFDYATNAYAYNVLHEIDEAIGSFHALGGVHADLDAFIGDLKEVQPMADMVGKMATRSPLRDPAKGDFRPSRGSAAIDYGVQAFVPWGLHAVVGEWNFTPRQDDPTIITDEHFFLTRYHINRSDYYTRPMYPLKGRGIGRGDFVDGPLENWTQGALTLDGERQHLALAQKTMAEPFVYTVGENQRTVAGPDVLQTPDIQESNFLVEAYVKIEPGETGVLVHKRDERAGYVLSVVDGGRLELALYQDGERAGHRLSSGSVADGDWHHLVAEVERGAADGLRVYVDGELANGEGAGAAPGGSLRNTGDFLVGGGPGLDHLACTIDFLRVTRGTLADARTTIEELYTWQFEGPAWRDFTGVAPSGRRDAGAIESR